MLAYNKKEVMAGLMSLQVTFLSLYSYKVLIVRQETITN